MINLRYPGADGRLKTLNFVINDEDYLESILTCGERVDGSSLFPYIEAGASDLYVVPRYRTAFRNPFGGIPAVDILCSYYTKDGEPLDMAPEQTLRRAHEELRRATGLDFHVMGELEFYVVSPKQDLFLAADQRGYHESTPFNKGAAFRAQAMKYIAQAGGEIKYGHSEVGELHAGRPHVRAERDRIPSHGPRVRRRSPRGGQMDHPHAGLRVRRGRDVRAEDHCGQGRQRSACPHASDARGSATRWWGRTARCRTRL